MSTFYPYSPLANKQMEIKKILGIPITIRV